MPYSVGTSDECPASRPHAVIKDNDGEVMGCHESEAAAQRQIAAIEADEDEQSAMSIQRFRTLPIRGVEQIDRDARVLRGVSCAQAVEALGHNTQLDETTIEQIVEHGNSARRGIKSRFTHPGLSSDGLGKYLGRLRNFRVDGDKAKADLHLSKTAAKAPGGNLAEYVMDLAEQEPDMFGMSVVIDTERVWTLEDGSEVGMIDGDGNRRKRPDNATTRYPVARIKDFVACDVVDEPAANRDGMFSASLWATNQLSEQVFGDLDRLLQEYGISPEKAFDFALKYFSAREVDLGEFAMAKDQEPRQDVTEITVDMSDVDDELTGLKAQLAEEAEARKEAEQRAQKFQDALDSSNERVAKLEEEAQRKRFAELCESWPGEPAKHVAILSALEEDGDAFAAYVETQNALAEQLSTGQLFAEVGSDREPVDETATQQLERKARELMENDASLSKEQAIMRAAQIYPELYAAHREGK